MIPGKKILIIDIGTYKVKVALCEYKNNQINILGYGEKKQEKTDIISGEIANIESISNTISKTIKKTLNNTNINPKNIIINIPSQHIISFGKNVSYYRKNKLNKITIEELDIMIGKIEKDALGNAKKDMKYKTGYNDVDMKLITSSITDIKIDNLKVTNPIGFIGEKIELSVLNIFIPISRYYIINTIGNYLSKNILSILPLEFSLPKLFENTKYSFDNILFIDLGNTKTSFIFQKNGIIQGFNKIEIGINDLINLIQKNNDIPSIEILNNIENSKLYLNEKEEFLLIWIEGFIIAVKELLNSQLIPHNINLIGGGNYNFIKNYIKNINFNLYNLHMLKEINFLEYDINEDTRISGDKSFYNKNNIGLISMIITSKEILNEKENLVKKILTNFLEKNEF